MRRIIAVLLALVMIGSAVDMSGVTVHAEETESVAQIGETKYSSFSEAMEAAQSGETVIALADSVEDFDIKNGVIFDAGSYIFNGWITNWGIIKGGTYKEIIRNEGTINGGTYNQSVENHGTIDGGTYNHFVENYGTINGGTYNGFIRNDGTINTATLNCGLENDGTINNLKTGDILLGSSFVFEMNAGEVNCTAHIGATDCEEMCSLCMQLNASAAPHTIGSDNKCTKCLKPVVARIGDRYFVDWSCLTVAGNNATAENPVTVTALAGTDWQLEIPQNVIFDGGSFPFNFVHNKGVIVGGVFSGLVRNERIGIINGGVFNDRIYNMGVINNRNAGDVILKDAEKYQDGGGTVNCQAHYNDLGCGEALVCKLCRAVYAENHIWNYTVSGTNISRTCSNKCKGTQTLTLAAPDSNSLIYDGTAIEAIVTGSLADAVNPTITYNTTDGSAPIYPGNYTASITVEDFTVSVEFEIVCEHVAGNVLYTGTGEKAPTCTESGLGHKECTKCGTVMESGIVVGVTEHSGELRHYEEPTCATEGYSGDTYCSGCGIWLSGGVTLSVTGHNYVGVVTRKATTDREGIRTYTCSKCGGSYTESIAKLIADTTAETPADKNDEKWEIIREELGDTNEGATVTVDMADTTVVPGTVFDDIKGKDITTIFVLENGITWSVNGKDITSEKVNDIDFGVKVGADANHTIPVEVINNVSGERSYTNISLAYEGEFGFKAVMALNMDAKNAGLFANLFYFNEQTNALEFICADEIAEDGTAELTFTHASEYTVVIDTEEMSGALDSSDASDTTEPDTEVNVEPEAEAEPANGESALWIILLAVLAAVIGAVVAWKRRKN